MTADGTGLGVAAPNTLSVTGVITDPATAAAAAGLIKLGTGRLTLSGPNTYTGPTIIRAGSVVATPSAYAVILGGPGGADLTGARSRLVLDFADASSPEAQVKSLLSAAYESGFLSGQLRSSTATVAAGLGYGITGNTVVVMNTLYGDANLDGRVDFADFVLPQSNFSQANTRFDQGNFNYDNDTDFGDFVRLQSNFGKTLAGARVAATREEAAAMTAFAATVVPEPSAWAACAVAGVLVRRRVKF